MTIFNSSETNNLPFFKVNPNSIAAIDGRIRKGDRILQVLVISKALLILTNTYQMLLQ